MVSEERKHRLYAFLRYNVSMKVERLYDRGWLTDDQWDWIDTFYEDRILKPIAWVLCRLLGHFPEMDHCGMPKHDFCLGCGKRGPDIVVDRHFLLKVRKYARVCIDGEHHDVTDLREDRARLDSEKWYATSKLVVVPAAWHVNDPLLPYITAHDCPGGADAQTDGVH